ncbi:hypothetical protein F2P79_012139 [Pimephales promelas]|nr:hypothetical protein F2P79_012139 [Pimephales promelas]
MVVYLYFAMPELNSGVHINDLQENRQTQRTIIRGKGDLNMASKTEVLLLLVAVMIASYGLTDATSSPTPAPAQPLPPAYPKPPPKHHHHHQQHWGISFPRGDGGSAWTSDLHAHLHCASQTLPAHLISNSISLGLSHG